MLSILRKILGVFLVIVGLLALLTPLTPGSWLGLIGLELLGIRKQATKWWHSIRQGMKQW